MTMIKYGPKGFYHFVLWVLAGFFFIPSAQAQVPSNSSGFEPEISLRLFYQKKRLNALFENEMRLQTLGRRYHSHRLGAYYRLLENLKFGFFGQVDYGVLHDDDWLTPDWRETNGRAEWSLITDLTPRWKIQEHSVLELKTRFVHNTFNDQNTLRLRPGYSHYFFETREHRDHLLWTLFAQMEFYLPLNYSREWGLYEFWLYLGALRHLDERMQVGVHAAFRQSRWYESQSFQQLFVGETYSKRDTGFILGLDFIYRWGEVE